VLRTANAPNLPPVRYRTRQLSFESWQAPADFYVIARRAEGRLSGSSGWLCQFGFDGTRQGLIIRRDVGSETPHDLTLTVD